MRQQNHALLFPSPELHFPHTTPSAPAEGSISEHLFFKMPLRQLNFLK